LAKFLLPLSEYTRVYQVAHGVIRDIGTAERACIFFASFGAMVLNKHYKVPATVVAGGLGLCVSGGDRPGVAFFGREQDGQLKSDGSNFHMWVQTETHLIDFMAPIFPEAFAEHGAVLATPRKMLQRPLAEEAATLDSLANPGDFYGMPNPELTKQLIDTFVDRASHRDLLHVADTWFGKRTGRQKPTIVMGDSHGHQLQLTLPRTIPTATW
jgi:hypothetical protein